MIDQNELHRLGNVFLEYYLSGDQHLIRGGGVSMIKIRVDRFIYWRVINMMVRNVINNE